MRHDRRRAVCLSEEYVRWKRMADVMYLAQKRKLAVKTLGKCVVCIILSEKLRRPTQDADNFIKGVIDWLQRVEIIHNDNLCDGGMWGWGDAPDGCRVIVNGKEWK
jgi:Holliday junction resolvase RusA-like endonuclease